MNKTNDLIHGYYHINDFPIAHELIGITIGCYARTPNLYRTVLKKYTTDGNNMWVRDVKGENFLITNRNMQNIIRLYLPFYMSNF